MPRQNQAQLRQWLGHNIQPGAEDTIVWRGLGPGVWSEVFKQEPPFPNGLSIEVSKENDQPAKIVAKKDGKTYEATGDKLADLPEEIRAPVERLLSAEGRQLRAFHFNAEKMQKQALEQALKAEGEAKKQLKRLEVRTLDGGAIDSLRKEVEQLRKEFQELKSSNKPTDGGKDSSAKQDESNVDQQ